MPPLESLCARVKGPLWGNEDPHAATMTPCSQIYNFFFKVPECPLYATYLSSSGDIAVKKKRKKKKKEEVKICPPGAYILLSKLEPERDLIQPNAVRSRIHQFSPKLWRHIKQAVGANPMKLRLNQHPVFPSNILVYFLCKKKNGVNNRNTCPIGTFFLRLKEIMHIDWLA